MFVTNHNSLSVVAAVLINDSKILACRRASNKESAGMWEFPGGKVEPGETEVDALRREIKEELGLSLGVLEFLNSEITKVGAKEIQLSCYVSLQQVRGLPLSEDHDQVRWVNKDEALGLKWAEPDLPALKLLIDQGRL